MDVDKQRTNILSLEAVLSVFFQCGGSGNEGNKILSIGDFFANENDMLADFFGCRVCYVGDNSQDVSFLRMNSKNRNVSFETENPYQFLVNTPDNSYDLIMLRNPTGDLIKVPVLFYDKIKLGGFLVATSPIGINIGALYGADRELYSEERSEGFDLLHIEHTKSNPESKRIWNNYRRRNKKSSVDSVNYDRFAFIAQKVSDAFYDSGGNKDVAVEYLF